MKVRLVRLALLGALGFWGWHWFFPSPQQIMRKRLSELAIAASISPNEAPLTRFAKIQRVASFFTDDAVVMLDVTGRSMQAFNGREEIRRAAMGARSMLTSMKVQFVDINIELHPDKQTSLARLTVTANLPGEKLPEVQELEVDFKKADRDWLITRVQSVKTLR
jgi:ketosteroid isomerase-like protein